MAHLANNSAVECSFIVDPSVAHFGDQYQVSRGNVAVEIDGQAAPITDDDAEEGRGSGGAGQQQFAKSPRCTWFGETSLVGRHSAPCSGSAF